MEICQFYNCPFLLINQLLKNFQSAFLTGICSQFQRRKRVFLGKKPVKPVVNHPSRGWVFRNQTTLIASSTAVTDRVGRSMLIRRIFAPSAPSCVTLPASRLKETMMRIIIALGLVALLPAVALAGEAGPPPAAPEYRQAVMTIHIPLRYEWKHYLEEGSHQYGFAGYLRDRARPLRVSGTIMFVSGLLFMIGGCATVAIATTPIFEGEQTKIALAMVGLSSVLVSLPFLLIGGRFKKKGIAFRAADAIITYNQQMMLQAPQPAQGVYP